MAGRRYGGHIRKMRENVFELRLYIGTAVGANGKRKKKYYTETFHGNMSDATVRMANIITEHSKGVLIDPTNVTLAEYLDEWYAKREKGWKASTRIHKQRALAHLKKELGSARLCAIQPLDIENAYERIGKRLEKAGHAGDGTLLLVHVCLSQALRQAIKWKLMLSNPAEDVKRPAYDRPKRQTWTAQEQQRFLIAARRYRLYPLFALLLRTGPRVGEAVALCWPNVNMDTNTYRIESTLRRHGTVVLEGTPKTESSARSVPFSTETGNALREWRIRQYKERLAAGPNWQDQVGRVFTTKHGQPLSYEGIRSTLKRVCAVAQVPYIGVHGLRHTFATNLVDAGMDPKTGSELLGHSSVEFFYDNYAHPAEERMRHAVLEAERFSQGAT